MRLPLVWIGCVFLLCACGDDTPQAAPARAWSFARIQGVGPLSDLSVLGDELFAVSEKDDRTLYAVSLRDLRHGAELSAQKLDFKVQPGSPIQGADAFAREGYNVEHVWPLPVAFVGVALRPPNNLYVVDRGHRLLYWGELVRGASNQLIRARLNFVFSLRGGERSGATKSDWRDHGPGLGALSALRNDRRVEDLYLIDHHGNSERTAGLRRLDGRSGQLGATVPISDAQGRRPDLRGLVWESDAKRYLALVGGGRGALVPFQEETMRTIRLGTGTPGPKADGASGWTGMALGDDGTLYLLSEDTPPVLAWRAPAKTKSP